ncbi:hypothetical protein ADEAN_000391800 [Angomonas deanei]|uniref:C3H1-type domain-containing protein n=1 Tax=Angomonas deanei TaxID=59799 RepID=A0A7G2C9N5_9TRYP|nr:hypothetical protein ADEAN_000391800 [Angomonas deanei]
MEGILNSQQNVLQGKAYVTKDVLTNPPTPIYIVNNDAAVELQNGFALTIDDIEPTAGWLSDRNNSLLDICFMHSFGKCFGKANDPSTCHQIHVKRKVLNLLRKRYTLPQRYFFSRTVKANVTPQFGDLLSQIAQRRFSLQYLEFKTASVEKTAGSASYEVQYRNWLVSSMSKNSLANPLTLNFISTSCLCWDFALRGVCPKGSSCSDIHANITRALTKDRLIRLALVELSKVSTDGDRRLVPG